MGWNKLEILVTSISSTENHAYPPASAKNALRHSMYYIVFGLIMMSLLALAVLEFEVLPIQWRMEELVALIGTIYTANLLLTLSLYLKQFYWD